MINSSVINIQINGIFTKIHIFQWIFSYDLGKYLKKDSSNLEEVWKFGGFLKNYYRKTDYRNIMISAQGLKAFSSVDKRTEHEWTPI